MRPCLSACSGWPQSPARITTHDIDRWGWGSVSKNWLIPIFFPPFFSLPVNFFCLSKICSFFSLKLEEIHSIWEGLYRGAMKPQRRYFSLAWVSRYNSAVVLPFSWYQQHKNVYSPLWHYKLPLYCGIIVNLRFTETPREFSSISKSHYTQS